MYSPINEEFMFQEMRDRVARMSAVRGKGLGNDGGKGRGLTNRRWRRKGAHLAR